MSGEAAWVSKGLKRQHRLAVHQLHSPNITPGVKHENPQNTRRIWGSLKRQLARGRLRA